MGWFSKDSDQAQAYDTVRWSVVATVDVDVDADDVLLGERLSAQGQAVARASRRCRRVRGCQEVRGACRCEREARQPCVRTLPRQ